MSYFKIDVKPFIYGIEQKFDIWLQRFGRAVDAALIIDASPAQKTAAYSVAPASAIPRDDDIEMPEIESKPASNHVD